MQRGFVYAASKTAYIIYFKIYIRTELSIIITLSFVLLSLYSSFTLLRKKAVFREQINLKPKQLQSKAFSIFYKTLYLGILQYLTFAKHAIYIHSNQITKRL